MTKPGKPRKISSAAPRYISGSHLDEGLTPDLSMRRRSPRPSHIEPSPPQLEDSPLQLEDPIPCPPALLARTLRACGVRTVGQLLEFDRAPPGRCLQIGPVRLRLMKRYRRAVGARAGVEPNPWKRDASSDPLPDPGPPLHVGDPLPDVPGILRALLGALGVVTVGQLLALDLEEVPHVKGLTGAKKMAFLAEYRRIVVANIKTGPRVEPDPPSYATLAELEAATLFRLTERGREIVRLRCGQGWTLDEVAQVVGLSREWVRQSVSAYAKKMRAPGFEAEALRLLGLEWCLGRLGPDVLHRGLSLDPTIPFEGARMLAEIVSFDWWARGDWLVRGRSLEDLSAEILATARRCAPIDRGGLERAALSNERFTEELVVRILAREGWQFTANGTIEPEESLRERIHRRMVAAGRPVHQSEVVPWMREYAEEVGSTVDGGLPTAGELKEAEQILMQDRSIRRTGRGEFAHLSTMGVQEMVLDGLVETCVSRHAGEAGPCDVSELLLELRLAGCATEGVTPHLLKDALRRHPGVRTWRKLWVSFDPD